MTEVTTYDMVKIPFADTYHLKKQDKEVAETLCGKEVDDTWDTSNITGYLCHLCHIVERLRRGLTPPPGFVETDWLVLQHTKELMEEAADEIERLRRDMRWLVDHLTMPLTPGRDFATEERFEKIKKSVK